MQYSRTVIVALIFLVFVPMLVYTIPWGAENVEGLKMTFNVAIFVGFVFTFYALMQDKNKY